MEIKQLKKGLILLVMSVSCVCFAKPSKKFQQLHHNQVPFLKCIDGPEVVGENDKWSPFAKCPKDYQTVGIAKIDLLGNHGVTSLHVNDLRCSDKGCRAYCIGNLKGKQCHLRARCCQISFRETSQK